jgi:serine/threonine-protein kinase RsbW
VAITELDDARGSSSALESPHTAGVEEAASERASDPRPLVALQLTSDLSMLELLQLISDRVSHDVGLDEDGRYWVGVAVREAAFNAIEHGHHGDTAKQIDVEFALGGDAGAPKELHVRVRDEGAGFDLREVPDPQAIENELKPSGRGLLLIRRVVDAVQIERTAKGGTEVRMTKRIHSSDPPGPEATALR